MAILVITVSKTLHSLPMSSYASNFQDSPFSGNHFKFHLSIPLTPLACTTDAESLYNCHLVFDEYQDMKKLRINTTDSLLTMIPDLPKQKIKLFYNSQNCIEVTNVPFNAIWKQEFHHWSHNKHTNEICSCMSELG